MYSYDLLLLAINDIFAAMKNLAFEAVCQFFGSQKKLAKVLGVTPAMINHVVTCRRPIPENWCPIIERETAGRIRCEQLRPDVDWAVLRQPIAKKDS
ncbi:MAG: helix-turn-helix domain-containing protein [Sutterella wadsworthensis]|nr:helix-turn-helix domain-containing protein [Sutterella wadsworthensis]